MTELNDLPDLMEQVVKACNEQGITHFHKLAEIRLCHENLVEDTVRYWVYGYKFTPEVSSKTTWNGRMYSPKALRDAIDNVEN